jgi:hypothetical protein
MTLSMIDTYSDSRKVGGDDTTRDYRIIFGVANDYLFDCLLKFIKQKSFSIEEKFPGFVKFLYERDYGVARLPRTGTSLRDYKKFKEEMYSYIKEFYDVNLFAKSLETLHEKSSYYKLYQQYFDKYQVMQVEPSNKVFSPQIGYRFKILNRKTKEQKSDDNLSVEHYIPQFDAHGYYYNLLLLDAYKKGEIKL